MEETLNALLDAEADHLCGARKYQRAKGAKDTRQQLDMHSADYLFRNAKPLLYKNIYRDVAIRTNLFKTL